LDQVIDTPAQLARMIILRSRNEFMRLKHEKNRKENNPENTNTISENICHKGRKTRENHIREARKYPEP